MQVIIFNLPGGHLIDAHLCVCELAPWQFFPPLAGAGFVHVRVRDWLPPPHVAEHDVHGLQ
jgi:hypothetical protein